VKIKNLLTQNIDKYGIINLIICVSIPAIMGYIIAENTYKDSDTYDYEEIKSTTSTTSSSTSTTTTTTKQCEAYPCPYNAVSGSSYCSIHKKGKTKKCAMCGTRIWDDETWCDDCLYESMLDAMGR